jgi:hypothetical protein
MRRSFRAALAAAALVLVLAPTSAGGQEPDPAGPDVQPTPRAECGPGSSPETSAQGRVPKEDFDTGRSLKGYWCNMELLSHHGQSGGYKVERYVDRAGRECAYYDTTLLFPGNATNLSSGELTGVAVLDMTDPRKPVRTANLLTPAMQSPHESMSLNHKRGLLAAVTANPVFYPGLVDIYDVSVDCRNPVLKASAPVGVLGHESGFAPDGNTFYVAALHAPAVTAIDVSDPVVPKVLGVYQHLSHGIGVSDDGNRIYMATYSNNFNNQRRGMVIYDVSDIQARKPNPQMREVSRLSWAKVSTPQINLPVTIGGKPYLVEMDEFGGGATVGAARIIDISDEKAPRVVSNLRLEVNQTEAQTAFAQDPGFSDQFQGYEGHYCSVPQREEPGIAACTFINSGLRVFDIRDPLNPREIAYFNMPSEGDSFAMSSAAFDPESGEIWYSDGNTGFYALKVTNGVWPFTKAAAPAVAAATAPRPRAGRQAGELPATGVVPPVVAGLSLLGLALVGRRATRRS